MDLIRKTRRAVLELQKSPDYKLLDLFAEIDIYGSQEITAESISQFIDVVLEYNNGLETAEAVIERIARTKDSINFSDLKVFFEIYSKKVKKVKNKQSSTKKKNHNNLRINTPQKSNNLVNELGAEYKSHPEVTKGFNSLIKKYSNPQRAENKDKSGKKLHFFSFLYS